MGGKAGGRQGEGRGREVEAGRYCVSHHHPGRLRQLCGWKGEENPTFSIFTILSYSRIFSLSLSGSNNIKLQ